MGPQTLVQLAATGPAPALRNMVAGWLLRAGMAAALAIGGGMMRSPSGP